MTARSNGSALGIVTVAANITATEGDPAVGNNADSEATLVKFLKGDSQNDLQTDLFLRQHGQRQNVVWLMNGVDAPAEAPFNPATPACASAADRRASTTSTATTGTTWSSGTRPPAWWSSG